jgi:hypothetical protein
MGEDKHGHAIGKEATEDKRQGHNTQKPFSEKHREFL